MCDTIAYVHLWFNTLTSHVSPEDLMFFATLLSFSRAIYSKSDSGSKPMIPIKIPCAYQGTTTRRPHPNDLTTLLANSSARGREKEGLPVNMFEETWPTLRYMKERLGP